MKILDNKILISSKEPETVEIEIKDSEIYNYLRLYENYLKLAKLLNS